MNGGMDMHWRTLPANEQLCSAQFQDTIEMIARQHLIHEFVFIRVIRGSEISAPTLSSACRLCYCSQAK